MLTVKKDILKLVQDQLMLYLLLNFAFDTLSVNTDDINSISAHAIERALSLYEVFIQHIHSLFQLRNWPESTWSLRSFRLGLLKDQDLTGRLRLLPLEQDGERAAASGQSAAAGVDFSAAGGKTLAKL